MSEITRRELLQIAAAATVVSPGTGAEAGTSEGSAETQRSAGPRELYTRSPIEVYTNTLSAVAGEELTLHVSTIARQFDLEIARIGQDETVVWSKKDVRGVFYATPEDAWGKGCRWPAA